VWVGHPLAVSHENTKQRMEKHAFSSRTRIYPTLAPANFFEGGKREKILRAPRYSESRVGRWHHSDSDLISGLLTESTCGCALCDSLLLK
jgi:hypothetical protein